MFFFFQAEDGIRDLVRSRGLGDVYKRQILMWLFGTVLGLPTPIEVPTLLPKWTGVVIGTTCCLLYTSDAADERSSVDLGGRRIIKQKTLHTKHR